MAAVLAAARLPEPVLTSEAPAERSAAAVGWSIIGTDITRLLPLIERTGVATAAELGPTPSSSGYSRRRPRTTRCC